MRNGRWARIAMIAVLPAIVCGAQERVPIELLVDASDLPRNLLHARMEFPVRAGEAAFWYPKWIPGTHAPSGPVENVGGLRFESPDGARLDWRRDPKEPHRFLCVIPEGTARIVVQLDYICSQPSTNSTGVDSFGNASAGILSWNTCVLYPEGYATDAIDVNARLALPVGWRLATSLRLGDEKDGVIPFAPVNLTTLVDSPVIAGEHLRSISLKSDGIPPVHLHLVSESAPALLIPDSLIASYGRLGTEAGALFGGAHFDEYHFLVTCSDQLPSLGLEHLRSSLNGVGERDLHKEEKIRGWVGYLLPHEFVHSWCGKYRRPVGMTAPDFHTPLDTSSLWVYEGLTQYLGDVLAVRSGIWSLDHYKQVLARNIGTLLRQEGRTWRALEDTASASHLLRGRSKHWSNLRRNQDYYNEGVLIWMEADAIVRLESDGKRSLDDFCRTFMGAALPVADVHPFEEEELLSGLKALANHDWNAFVQSRVRAPQETLPMELAGRLGYRVQYASKPSKYQSEQEEDRKFVSELDTIGATFTADGVTGSDLVPGMPAEKAGLAPGMKVIGVNGRTFSKERLRDAIADSVSRRSIELLVVKGDVITPYSVTYAEGPRYLELVRDESRPDVLAQILAARKPGAL